MDQAIIGLPQKSRMFLRGMRLLPPRAGMMARFIRYWLLVIGYWLLGIGCWVFVSFPGSAWERGPQSSGGMRVLIGDIGPEVGDVYSPMVTGRLKSPLHVGRCIPGAA